MIFFNKLRLLYWHFCRYLYIKIQWPFLILILKDLNNEKMPGTDGLPADFYKLVGTNIKYLVTESILDHIVKNSK